MTSVPDPLAPSSALQYKSMLFLASHGLQTPLSAIRWGCGRLKRMGEKLPPEFSKVTDDIQREARLLSQMFDWLLLLAKVEEGAHVPDEQQVFLGDFLSAPARTEHLPRPFAVQLECPPDLKLQIDRLLLESVVQALLIVVSVSSEEETVKITVESDAEADLVSITLYASLKLSLLDSSAEATDVPSHSRVVGGVPGFLLAVSASLAASMGASVDSVQDNGETQGIRLQLPLTPPLSLIP